MMQLLIRQAAKEAFIQVDSCNKIRKAMLRKAVPVRGPGLQSGQHGQF